MIALFLLQWPLPSKSEDSSWQLFHAVLLGLHHGMANSSALLCFPPFHPCTIDIIYHQEAIHQRECSRVGYWQSIMPVIEHEVILQKIFSKNAWSQCKYLYLHNQSTKTLEKWLIKSAIVLLIDMVNSNAHNCLWEKSYSLFGSSSCISFMLPQPWWSFSFLRNGDWFQILKFWWLMEFRIFC